MASSIINPIASKINNTYYMRTILWIVIVIIVIVGGWYLWMAMSAAPAPVTTPTGTTVSTTTTVAQPIIGSNLALGTSSNTKLGTYLVGYNGMTVYTYDKDATDTSNCTGQCAVVWPPYIVSSSDNIQNIQTGVTGNVGTLTRDDGTLQLTYNGMPLYFFASDTPSGAPTGQGVGGFSVAKP
jgi:predicted lipoprotein with Yx(FWY)xxD motif